MDSYLLAWFSAVLEWRKTLKFILGMLVRKKTSGCVCLMASLTSFKTSSEAVSSMTTKHPISRFKRCSTTRITSRPNGLLTTSGVIYLRTKRRASKTPQRSRHWSKFSILRSRSSKLRQKRNFLISGARHHLTLKLLKVRERKGIVLVNPPNSASISSARRMPPIPIISKVSNEGISGREHPNTLANTGVTHTPFRCVMEVSMKQSSLLASVVKQSVVLWASLFKLRRCRQWINLKLSRKLHNLHSSISNWSRFNSVKLKRWCDLLERGTRQSIMLKPWKESILQDIFL